MKIKDRAQAFVKLGYFLDQFKVDKIVKNESVSCNEPFFKQLQEQIQQAVHHNGWFTDSNVLFALETWAQTLSESNIEKWIKQYNFDDISPKTIGIVTAGNIPLVGFHDFITVLMSGHKLLIKQSSNDQKLLPVLAGFLICIAPQFIEYITFTESPLKNIDAVIATGSNNTARYFEHYFNKYPNIIRKNRNAVAILTGNESQEELENLGEDIFRYFGLGCRSVSKIFVPMAYDFDVLFKAIYKQNSCIDYKKYKNNYDYNKTVYLMSQIPILENGFFILKEDNSYASPIATLFYEYYNSPEELEQKLSFDQEKIQCVVTNQKLGIETVSFGQTQLPQLWDYADGVDTMEFLLKL
jgi:hypothetical protein